MKLWEPSPQDEMDALIRRGRDPELCVLCEDTGTRWPSAREEEEPATQAPALGLPASRKKINLCCLKLPSLVS